MKGVFKKGHTSCRPGKKVRMKLLDGTYVFGKFKEKVGETIFLEVGGKVIKYRRQNVIGLVIWKPLKQYQS